MHAKINLIYTDRARKMVEFVGFWGDIPGLLSKDVIAAKT